MAEPAPRFRNLADPRSHLAAVQPIGGREAGRVLSLTWKLCLNAAMILMPLAISALVVPAVLAGAWISWSRLPWILLAALTVAVALQVGWAASYPEWPMNLWLLRRLRAACHRRLGGTASEAIAQARMVEWVPREHWSATKLDSANDVMLIQIGDHGVVMEGDSFRYHFPPASLIDAHVESLRPSGCFHQLHFAVLTVRGEEGPLEWPLAYRDHRLGQLNNRDRHAQTQQLCEQIREIATGADASCCDPTYRVAHAIRALAHHDPAQRDPAHHDVPAPKRLPQNPYAAPASH